VAAVAVVLALLAVADRAGLFGRAQQSDYAKYHDKTFTVANVVDGDTLDVACPDQVLDTTRIRLLGVDTPETVKPDTPVQHYGREASGFLGNLRGRQVRLELSERRTRDNYGRLLAYVILPAEQRFATADGESIDLPAGTNVCEAIVATGHGYADPRYPNPDQRALERAQRAAMKARRGLWKDVTCADLPYYYRQEPHKLTLPWLESR